jgi:hypothetical protein
MTTCNSTYFYVVSAITQIAWIVELQLIVYMVQFIVTTPKPLIFNYYITSLQLQPWRHANVSNFHPYVKTWHLALWNFLDQVFF